MIIAIVSLLVGFVAGALVFRNNAKKAEAVVSTAKAAADKLKK